MNFINERILLWIVLWMFYVDDVGRKYMLYIKVFNYLRGFVSSLFLFLFIERWVIWVVVVGDVVDYFLK